MIRHILKVTALLAVARWLGPRKKVIFLHAALLVAIFYSHSEYLSFATLSGERQNLEASFLLKNLLVLLTLISFSHSVYRIGRPRKDPRAAEKPTAATPKELGKKDESLPVAEDDGFDFLRKKSVLESKKSKILNR
jgi:hypothetical protein